MLSDQLKKYFRSFTNKALIITVSFFAIYVIILFFVPAVTLSPATPAIIIFFLVLTLTIFYYQLRASASRVSKFVNVFLMATGFKLLGFLIIIGVYSFLNKSDAVPFVISFFIIYMIFTIFEITQLLKVQKQLGSKK
jgi:hypothetical protein